MKISRRLLHGLVILNFAGQPVVELKDGNEKPKLRENLELKSDTFIKTEDNEYVVLKVNDMYRMTILPNSIFTVEGVKQKGAFDVRSVNIRSGQVHLLELPRAKVEKNFFPKEGSNAAEESSYDAIKIDSDFFSILTEENQKLSLLVDSNPKKAFLSVCNLGKDYRLDLFNHEIPQNLKPNEAAQFQGILDAEGKVAYDLLLQKRKIPQGKWLDKKSCSEDQIRKIQSEVEKNQQSEAQKNNAAKLKQIAQKKKDDARFLCHRPYGQLNQCHFILTQKKCLRTRCNAEGKWAESAEVGIDKNHCVAQGEVKECGY